MKDLPVICVALGGCPGHLLLSDFFVVLASGNLVPRHGGFLQVASELHQLYSPLGL